MRVEDYEFNSNGNKNEISSERADELIKKIKDQVRKGFIAHFQILDIGKNDDEYDFIYRWLDENEITIRGTNISNDEINKIREEEDKENLFYNHIKRIGKSGNLPILDSDEQKKLFDRLQEISKEDKEYQEIRDKLVETNIRLVKWLVNSKSIRTLKIESDDAIQMGCIGLMDAVEKFDPTRGVAFSTYAVKAIYRRIIREEMFHNREFAQYIGSKDKLSIIEEIQSQFQMDLKRKPTAEEISSMLGVSLKSTKNLLELQQLHQKESIEGIRENKEETERKFDTRIDSDGQVEIENGSYIDEDGVTVISSTLSSLKSNPIENAEIDDIKEIINKILTTLTPREEKVIRLRFGLDGNTPKTLEETGEIFDATRERIRKIEAKALRKLRHPYRAKSLRDYIGDSHEDGENSFMI